MAKSGKKPKADAGTVARTLLLPGHIGYEAGKRKGYKTHSKGQKKKAELEKDALMSPARDWAIISAKSKILKKVKKKGLKGAARDAKDKILYGEEGKKEYQKKAELDMNRFEHLKVAAKTRGLPAHDASGKLPNIITGPKRQPKTYRPHDTSKRKSIKESMRQKDADGVEVDSRTGKRKGKRRLKSAGAYDGGQKYMSYIDKPLAKTAEEKKKSLRRA